MDPMGWVLAVLACFRLTMLVTSDRVTEPVRARASGRLAGLVGCPWCVSVWLAPLVVGSGLWWSSGWGWQLVAGSLAAAGAVGALSVYAQPDP